LDWTSRFSPSSTTTNERASSTGRVARSICVCSTRSSIGPGSGSTGVNDIDAANVDALGRVSQRELAELYSGAVATLHSAKFEEFRTPVLESLACGTPVVVADRGGAAELVTEECGVVTDDLDAGVREAESLRAADCRAVAEGHSWTHVPERTAAAVERVRRV
jgi:glycosyltransferase involved in cell wall biosynthesis